MYIFQRILATILVLYAFPALGQYSNIKEIIFVYNDYEETKTDYTDNRSTTIDKELCRLEQKLTFRGDRIFLTTSSDSCSEASDGSTGSVFKVNSKFSETKTCQYKKGGTHAICDNGSKFKATKKHKPFISKSTAIYSVKLNKKDLTLTKVTKRNYSGIYDDGSNNTYKYSGSWRMRLRLSDSSCVLREFKGIKKTTNQFGIVYGKWTKKDVFSCKVIRK